MSSNPPRLVVLISGSGTNLQAILDACASGELDAQVVAVFSNKPDAYGLERARQAHVPALCVPKPKEQDRRAYDAWLAGEVIKFRPNWIILAGWMRLMSSAFLEHFPGHVINLHPALPGTFPGTHAIQRAFDAYQAGEITQTGVMVHLVPDEGVDSGPVLAQVAVPIFASGTLETLEERIHAIEHTLLVSTLEKISGSLSHAKSHSLCS
jgi:phosphoribosylglycinamide formyltransferase 1